MSGQPSTPPSTLNDLRLTGQVLRWRARAGTGVIQDVHSRETYFAHHTQLRPKHPPLVEGWKPVLHTGEYVTFTVGRNPTQPAKLCALDVQGIAGTLMCDFAAWRPIMYRRSEHVKISRVFADKHPNPQVQEEAENNVETDETGGAARAAAETAPAGASDVAPAGASAIEFGETRVVENGSE